MEAALEPFFERLLERVEGLLGVMVSDRDGVAMVQVGETGSPAECLAATFPMAADHASKLRLGQCKSITTFFRDRVLVHVNDFPLVITLVATEEGNAGLLLALLPEIRAALDPLKGSMDM